MRTVYTAVFADGRRHGVFTDSLERAATIIHFLYYGETPVRFETE